MAIANCGNTTINVGQNIHNAYVDHDLRRDGRLLEQFEAAGDGGDLEFDPRAIQTSAVHLGQVDVIGKEGGSAGGSTSPGND